jgi:hypothetical protein
MQSSPSTQQDVSWQHVSPELQQLEPHFVWSELMPNRKATNGLYSDAMAPI